MLIIDTAKSKTYIALIWQNKVFKRVLDIQTKVSENLLPNIESLLNEASIDLKDIKKLCIVTGPGSFTGLRVGISTIKAFAQALNIKVVGKNSFEVLSNVVKDGVVVLKCTNSSRYYCEFNSGQISEIGVINNDNLDKFAEKQLYQLEEEFLENLNDNCNIITNYMDILIEYFNNIEDTEFQEYKTIEPYYVQLSQAELNLCKKGENK